MIHCGNERGFLLSFVLYANSRLVSSSHCAFSSCCANLTSLFASCLLTISPQHRVPSSRAPTQPFLQCQHPQSAAHCTSNIQGRHHPVSATTNIFSRWAAASWAFQPSGNTGIVLWRCICRGKRMSNFHRVIRWNCNLIRRGGLVRLNRWRKLCSLLLSTAIQWIKKHTNKYPTNHTKRPITQYYNSTITDNTTTVRPKRNSPNSNLSEYSVGQ